MIGSAVTGGLLDAVAPEAVAAAVGDGATDDIASQAATDEAGAGGGGDGDPSTDDPPCSTATPGGDSFTAATLVLLASGKAVPISSLKPGDKVLASDTNT